MKKQKQVPKIKTWTRRQILDELEWGQPSKKSLKDKFISVEDHEKIVKKLEWELLTYRRPTGTHYVDVREEGCKDERGKMKKVLDEMTNKIEAVTTWSEVRKMLGL